MTCPTCHQTHDPRKCTSHVDRDPKTGEPIALRPCGAFPVRGAKVCVSHGAGAPQVKRAAQRRVVEAKAERWLARQQITPVVDPISEIAVNAGKAEKFLEKIEQLVSDLGEQRWRFTDEKGAEQLHSFIALLERALDRYHRQLVDMAKLNLEERLTRVTEIQAEAMLAVMLAAVDDPKWGLDYNQRALGRKIIAAHLPTSDEKAS